ncbi:Phosphoribosylaminoimidazole-succinocarboxamide synthase [uncultured delta proteobacterium]|uniref:Phosphoribosylaminoimidazole-succinocarboxamide synthase n=1 Tax=uncultured delta proteobacterium TaxID=34034 RepID=A0A212JVJ6_9DELT|nr:Phosphoribosylaminoimidazole-succinocarboxamide synthase [uncultured delta proteobacterium]
MHELANRQDGNASLMVQDIIPCLKVLEKKVKVVNATQIKEYPLLARGKVRDIYEIDADTLLLVTTDRMSAFDVIMSSPIPYKGVVLNQITLFWMDRFKDIIPNHIISADAKDLPATLAPYAEELEGRFVLAKKATPLLLECIVRGHITGSGWKDYLATGSLCGHVLPKNLQESAKLDQVLFTPSTKAELGEHDENITEAAGAKLIGEALYAKVKDVTIKIFTEARAYAETRGIIIADTKFEFGLRNGELIWIDEALTPDSSRFWPLEGYEPGRTQPSFDKQFLRNWLLKQPWNMAPPPPPLPAAIVRETAERYIEAYRLLTGKDLGVTV